MKTNINQVKERPVIFNAQEVIATLAGDKTQFRIPIINNRDTAILFGDKKWRYDGMEFKEDGCCEPDPKGEHYMEELDPSEDEVHQYTERYESVGYCPLGSVGDNLWVQEPTHTANSWDWFYDATYSLVECKEPFTPNDLHLPFDDEHQEYTGPISAEHMPPWASRLLLEITDIRIERVQETSHDDAVAEGVHHFDIEARLRDQPLSVAQIVFSRYWDIEYQDDFETWETNPWVWVVEFKVVEGV